MPCDQAGPGSSRDNPVEVVDSPRGGAGSKRRLVTPAPAPSGVGGSGGSRGVNKYKPVNRGREDTYNELGYRRIDSYGDIELDETGAPVTLVCKPTRETWNLYKGNTLTKPDNLKRGWNGMKSEFMAKNRLKTPNFILVTPNAKHIKTLKED